MIYVTSMPIAPTIVEYYLALLPGVIPSHAHAPGSHLISVDDASPRSLSEKLLERPRLLRRIADLIPDRMRAPRPYNTTELERDLALALGIPMFGADPRHADLGTKTGCRRLFAQEKVSHPIGVEDLRSIDDAVTAILELRKERPRARGDRQAQRGRSGWAMPWWTSAAPRAGITGRAGPDRTTPAADAVRGAETPYDAYVAKLAERRRHRRAANHRGRVAQPERAAPDHPDRRGRAVVDARPVARRTHRTELSRLPLPGRFRLRPSDQRREAARVGARLAREGVLGRFAIDFVVVKDPAGAWSNYAIELNLRKGGTTHPFLTLQFLTDGRYDATTGLFLTQAGRNIS